MTTIQARWISLGLMALAALFELIAIISNNETIVIVMGIAGLVVFAASGVIQFVFHRCPYCGRFLDKNFWGEHCQYCGNLLMEK